MNRALSLSIAVTLIACGDQAPARPDAVYRVRGEVVGVHGHDEDARVTIAHEAIPTFKDRSGNAGGMAAMKMAFGVAAGVDLKAFVPGSQWELTFEVSWAREPALRIVTATPLPPGTRLALQ